MDSPGKSRSTKANPIISVIGAALWLLVAIGFLLRALLQVADNLSQRRPVTLGLALHILVWAIVLAVWTWIGGNAFSRYRRQSTKP